MNAPSSIHTSSVNPMLSPEAKKHTEAVNTAQKWVAQTFFGTMLKQMRKSPFKSEIFDGGRGGEAFNEMFDQQLSERMSRGAGSKLVNSIVRKIEGKAAYAKMSKLTKKGIDPSRVAAIGATSYCGWNRGTR